MITIKYNDFVIEVGSIKEAREFITNYTLKPVAKEMTVTVPKKPRKHFNSYKWTPNEVLTIIGALKLRNEKKNIIKLPELGPHSKGARTQMVWKVMTNSQTVKVAPHIQDIITNYHANK